MKRLIYLSIFFLLSSCNNDEINFDNVKDILGTWNLKTVIIGGDILVGPPPSSNSEIIFSKESNKLIFKGTSICSNQYGGQILNTINNSISFSEISTTLIGCPNEDFFEFENNYLNWLKNSVRYEIINNILSLYFDDNSKLVFEKE